MQKLTRSDLWSLEQYAEQRADFRRKVLAHKAHRQVALGEHVRLYFEDRLTLQYQIQEMLRIERVFEPAGIQEELDTYNSLIPDGSNWKATLMIEYEDSEQRKAALERLVGLEHRVWVRIGSGEPIYAIADEDLDRATADKTSAVHFLRFELPEAALAGVHQGEDVSVGIELPAYRIAGVEMAPEVIASLRADLDPIES